MERQTNRQNTLSFFRRRK